MDKRPPLNDRQRLFAKHYASSSNGTRSAIAAGYSRKGADSAAVRLLKDERILALIAEWTDKFTRQAEAHKDAQEIIDEARLEEELSHAALADPRRLFDPEGRLIDPLDLDESTARAISSFKVRQTKDGGAKLADVRFVDKTVAIKMLGQQRGMFVERREYMHKLSDMTDDELREELEKINEKHGDIMAAAEAHGVKLN